MCTINGRGELVVVFDALTCATILVARGETRVPPNTLVKIGSGVARNANTQYILVDSDCNIHTLKHIAAREPGGWWYHRAASADGTIYTVKLEDGRYTCAIQRQRRGEPR